MDFSLSYNNDAIRQSPQREDSFLWNMDEYFLSDRCKSSPWNRTFHSLKSDDEMQQCDGTSSLESCWKEHIGQLHCIEEETFPEKCLSIGIRSNPSSVSEVCFLLGLSLSLIFCFVSFFLYCSFSPEIFLEHFQRQGTEDRTEVS